jgi:hypothetical protein
MKQPLIGRVSSDSREPCCDDALGQRAPESELRITRPSAARRLPLGDLVDALVTGRLGWPIGHVSGYEFDTARSQVMAVITLDAVGSPSIVLPADRLRLRQAGEYVLEATEVGVTEHRRMPAAIA